MFCLNRNEEWNWYSNVNLLVAAMNFLVVKNHRFFVGRFDRFTGYYRYLPDFEFENPVVVPNFWFESHRIFLLSQWLFPLLTWLFNHSQKTSPNNNLQRNLRWTTIFILILSTSKKPTFVSSLQLSSFIVNVTHCFNSTSFFLHINILTTASIPLWSQELTFAIR